MTKADALVRIKRLADTYPMRGSVNATLGSWWAAGLLSCLTVADLDAAIGAYLASEDRGYPTPGQLIALGKRHRAERDRRRFYVAPPDPTRTVTAAEMREAWERAGVEFPRAAKSRP